MTPRCLARSRSRMAVLTGTAVLAGTTLLAACASSPDDSGLTRPAAHTVADSHTVTLAQPGLSRASLAVLSGAASVTVTATPMGGQLLRVSTPADSQVRPELTNNSGRVELFLTSTGLSGPAAVSVQVNSAVTWQLQFSGGASETVLARARGKLAGIDFTAGCSLIEASLPRPDRTVTITIAGVASQVRLTAPPGVPTRLRLYGGASLATLGSVSYSGLAGGTVLASPGWSAAANRYDVQAPAGVSMISVSALR